MDFWKSEEAEKRFGEVMKRALANAPQTVLGPDSAAVVVMSETDHHRLVLASQRLIELVEVAPAARELGEGKQNAREFIESPAGAIRGFGGKEIFDIMQSSPLAQGIRDGDIPEDWLERSQEASRHCECCARRQNDCSVDAAD